MRKPRLIVAVLALTAVVVATAGSPAAAETRKEGDIVDTAVQAGQFTTLTSLLKRARLVGALQDKGPFTVLAPTDAAFAKVPESTLAVLRADRAKLRSMLQYHVIAGRVTAAKVTKLRSAMTLNGQSVQVRVRGGRVFIGGARVVKTDVPATNGVIHVIDRVLVPR
jgi:transforming growth factor-beta-induced protein